MSRGDSPRHRMPNSHAIPRPAPHRAPAHGPQLISNMKQTMRSDRCTTHALPLPQTHRRQTHGHAPSHAPAALPKPLQLYGRQRVCGTARRPSIDAAAGRPFTAAPVHLPAFLRASACTEYVPSCALPRDAHTTAMYPPPPATRFSEGRSCSSGSDSRPNAARPGAGTIADARSCRQGGHRALLCCRHGGGAFSSTAGGGDDWAAGGGAAGRGAAGRGDACKGDAAAGHNSTNTK